jgi:uncharacterized protein YijF (DUF1287 family)
MERRQFIGSIAAVISSRCLFAGSLTPGRRLAAAALAQVNVTHTYDPSWTPLRYPGGDVDRSKGVCADVVIRAGRDGLGLDLQKLVHEDMVTHFDSYPARRVWGERAPDTSIDHRRVLNLQTYFERCGCQIWRATRAVAGDKFPAPLGEGDILTWLLDARLPHMGIVVSEGLENPADTYVVHNIGGGAEKWALADLSQHRAVGHYRWPKP